MRYRFGDCEFDAARLDLRRGGTVVEAQPKTLVLLKSLLENRDRLMSKDELIAQVWDGRAISDDAISSQIKLLRKAIGDDSRDSRLVRTVYRHGFCLTGDIAVEQAGEADGRPAIELPRMQDQSRRAARPSIAVLPFQLVGVAGPHAVLAEALPDEIIEALSRTRWLFVTARSSSFQLRSFRTTPEQVREQLKVDYCLAGRLEVAGDHFGVSVELVDTRDGGLVWNERMASHVDGVHEVRQELVRKLVETIEIRLPDYEAARARLNAPDNLGAWELFHLGLSEVLTLRPAAVRQAAERFRAALDLDPQLARAHAGLANAYWWSNWDGQVPGGAVDFGPMQDLARTAIELDPLDPFVNLNMALSHCATGQILEAEAYLRNAMRIAPNYPQSYGLLACLLTFSGRAEEALPMTNVALELSPLDPQFVAMSANQIVALLALGRILDAANWTREMMSQRPLDNAAAFGAAICAFHFAGEFEEAVRLSTMMGRQFPGVSADAIVGLMPFLTPGLRATFVEGLSPYGLWR